MERERERGEKERDLWIHILQSHKYIHWRDRVLYYEVKTQGSTLKTEGSERKGNYKRLVVGESVKNPRKSKESSPLPYLTIR